MRFFTPPSPWWSFSGWTKKVMATAEETMAIRYARVVAGATGLLMTAAAATAQSSVSFSWTATVPDEYRFECQLDRTELEARVVAANPNFYPEFATRTAEGWLIYDEFERQVVELDEELRGLRRWGREGDGPLEYRKPVSAMRLPAGEVLVVDNSPPSFLLFGGEQPNEHRLRGIEPEHAMVRDDGTVLVAGKHGDLHVFTPEAETLGQVATRRDLGMTETQGEEAAYPVVDIKPPFVGFVGPSTVWNVEADEEPRMVLQRCVHEDLARVHEQAPTIPFGNGKLGTIPITVVTMRDYLVLPHGFLVLGALVVNEERDRSIEYYDRSGNLVEAWRLTGYPAAHGRFDPHNPKRILIWNKATIDGILLLEVENDRFPGGA